MQVIPSTTQSNHKSLSQNDKKNINFKGAELKVTKQSLSDAIESMCNDRFYQEHLGKKPLSLKELTNIVETKFKQLEAIYEKYKDDKIVKVTIAYNSPVSPTGTPRIMGIVTPESPKNNFFACPSTIIDSTKNNFPQEIDEFVSKVKNNPHVKQ